MPHPDPYHEIKLSQKHYKPLIVDNTESDIIQIWQHGKYESNVIQIERESLKEFIEVLKLVENDTRKQSS